MKRIALFAAGAAVLLAAGVGIGLSLTSGAGNASAQQPAATATPDSDNWMLNHMQQMHGADGVQSMREYMDSTFGQGSFDQMLDQCEHNGGPGGMMSGTPWAGGTPWPGGMMGGGGMMGRY